MRILLYRICQCTWGFLQTFSGFIVFLFNIKKHRFSYHGAIITEWNLLSSVSLGMFVFVAKDPRFTMPEASANKSEIKKRLVTHEYGHTIQSLMLGPLYLIIIGIPSSLWGFLPCAQRKRKQQNVSYFSFFTENWADRLGKKATGHGAAEYIKTD